MPRIITKTEQETIDLAKSFAKTLKGGEIIGLIGDLGAGKTCFSQGLAAALKAKGKVNSPTFVVVKIYPVKSGNIRLLCHIDAYRLKSYDDLKALGVEDYLGQAQVVSLIEWADRVKDGLPKDTKYLRLEAKNENQRIIQY